MTSAFLSHSSVDKPFARRLTDDLEKNKIKVWLDEQKIRAGHSIVERINNGLAKNKFVLLAISSNFLSSEWATWETNASIAAAVKKREKKATVIPLLLEDVWDSVPPLLSDKLYIDFRGYGNIVEYRRSLGRLTAVLCGTKTPPKLKRRVPRVLVTGGRDPKYNTKAFQTAYEFGRLLGNEKYPAVCGTAVGVDEHFSRGYTEAIKKRSADSHRFLTCYFGRGRSPSHAFGAQLESKFEKREEGIPEFITESDVVVIFGGSKNTQYVGILALLENKVVLPVAATSGAARDVHNIILSRYDKTFASSLPRAKFMSLANTSGTPKEMAKQCFDLIKSFNA